MTASTQTFPAKLLLFGEYTVLYGGRALAIPAPRWTGQFVQDQSSTPDQRLLNWVAYLRQRSIWPEQAIEDFTSDIANGWRFASTIPDGYGLGSSGALCAAAYARYREAMSDQIPVLRNELAGMESFFHGTSSGMDPLVSYLQQPVLREDGSYRTPKLIDAGDDAPSLFLVDSGQSRSTTRLVTMFRERCADAGFWQRLLAPMLMTADQLIEAFINRQWDLFWDLLSTLSDLQYRNLDSFIPEDIRDVWSHPKGNDVKLKLCGAGGGGMFLGFARSPEVLQGARDIPGYVNLQSNSG